MAADDRDVVECDWCGMDFPVADAAYPASGEGEEVFCCGACRESWDEAAQAAESEG